MRYSPTGAIGMAEATEAVDDAQEVLRHVLGGLILDGWVREVKR